MPVKQLSVKWKIYSIVLVSTLGFGIYLGFNLWVNYANSRILTAVKETYFPILENSSKSAVLLDRMNEMLLTAVQTSEHSFVQEAEAAAREIQRLLRHVEMIEPTRKQELGRILGALAHYVEVATQISLEMVEGTADYERLPDRITAKEAIYRDFRAELDAFIAFAKSRFEADIAAAELNSSRSLATGFLIWVGSICLLTATAVAIARLILGNINRIAVSLKEIAAGSGDFNRSVRVVSDDEIGRLGKSFNDLLDKLKERTNDLDGMMRNMHQGLLTITQHETVHPEYSAYLEQIFECSDIAGAPYDRILFAHASLGSDELSQVRAAVSALLQQDELMWGFNCHLLPGEYEWERDGAKKIIELDWDPIVADGIIDKIMVTARDVTALRAFQRQAETQRLELEMVGHILAVTPEKFDRFFDNASDLIAQMRAILCGDLTDKQAIVSKLFVNMHTIKGNARTLGFAGIRDVVHDAEHVYAALRRDSAAAIDRQVLLAGISEVEHSLNAYRSVRVNKLGFLSGADSHGGAAGLTKAVLAHLVDSCQALLGEEPAAIDRERLARAVRSAAAYLSQPVAKVLRDQIESLPGLARELGKQPPRVVFAGQAVSIHSDGAAMLQDVFTHLFRNALDHGLETAAERLAAGKAAQGTITISSAAVDGRVQLSVRDDGRGLALGRIREETLSRGVSLSACDGSAERIADWVFESGCSTADKVTSISGRGVGMCAVRSFLRERGGDATLVLAQAATPSAEYVPFEVVLTLPCDAAGAVVNPALQGG